MFTITVTAENGRDKTDYVVTITRQYSPVATLSSLTLSEGTLSPEFDEGVKEYTASVSSDTNHIDLTATAKDKTISSMNWKVDLGGGQSVSGKSMNAADFTEVQDFEDVGEDDLTEYVTSEGLEEMGKVYIDPQTGKYYIMTRDATAADETNKDN